jgi:hypothetical protein
MSKAPGVTARTINPPPWWATAFWPHWAQLLAAMGATFLIDIVLVMVAFVLFDPDQTRSILTIMVPTMVILLAVMPLLSVDRDRLRARALLGNNLREIAVQFDPRLAASLPTGSLSRAQDIILANAVVQRELPPALLWALDFILLIVGTLLGKQFAQDFAPPNAVPGWEWAPKAFAVLVPILIAGLIVCFARVFARLDRDNVNLFTQLAAEPGRCAVCLPLYHDRFSRKFYEDIRQAVALASSPPDSLVAVSYFVPAARQSRTWRPDNLLDLSFTLYLLGVGLILGAVFQVFG